MGAQTTLLVVLSDGSYVFHVRSYLYVFFFFFFFFFFLFVFTSISLYKGLN